MVRGWGSYPVFGMNGRVFALLDEDPECLDQVQAMKSFCNPTWDEASSLPIWWNVIRAPGSAPARGRGDAGVSFLPESSTQSASWRRQARRWSGCRLTIRQR